MNYIIENNIDFFGELNNELDDESEQTEKCLLTHLPLEENYITLDCQHKFNYLPIYNEVVNQKMSNNYLETTYLSINQIKCPYCRTITDKLLPYIEHENVLYKRGVNFPMKYCLKIHTCQWVIKSGKNRNSICGKSALKTENCTYCSSHLQLYKCKQIKVNQDKFIESQWTDYHETINKKYNISQLKQLLKNYNNNNNNNNNNNKNKVLISGNKKQLVYRVIEWGLIDNGLNHII